MNRYQRQMQVAPIGQVGQEKLSKAHIGIVGVGGLGSPVSLYLAGAGIGKITLIDHDTVSLTNLHRQVLFRETDIDRLKTDVASKTLCDLNRDIDIQAYAEKITIDNIDRLLLDVDVIVDACDNFAVSYLLSDFASKHGKPLVSASVMQTSGYVGVYCCSSATQWKCPSLRAVFPNPPEVGEDCNSVGVIGTAAGIIGTIQAQEVIKVILGDSQQLAGRLLSMDCWTYRQNIIDFSSAPEPDSFVKIIAESAISPDDWVIDVRSDIEAKQQPQKANQQAPMNKLVLSSLPTDKRLVFICVSGQRALSAADRALQAGYNDVAICL